jgi:hypothetical protein
MKYTKLKNNLHLVLDTTEVRRPDVEVECFLILGHTKMINPLK